MSENVLVAAGVKSICNLFGCHPAIDRLMGRIVKAGLTDLQSMGPGHCSVERKIVGIGNLATAGFVRLLYVVGQVVFIAEFLCGIEGREIQPHLRIHIAGRCVAHQ